MKRKVYATRRERMIDRILGFLAFPLVNIALVLILWVISRIGNPTLLLVLVSALPWLVNGIVLVLAFLLRPEFGVGYIAFIGVALTVVGALSVVFVAACFVSVLAARVIGDQAIWVFFALMVVGMLVFVVIAINVIQGWW